MMQQLWTTFWQFLKKSTANLPDDAAVLLLGVYPREVKPSVLTRPMNVFSGFIHSSQKAETTQRIRGW